MRASGWLCVVLAGFGCGAPSEGDGGVDASVASDASVVMDAGTPGLDAGPLPEVDAGPPPPRTVFGSADINGATVELNSGYGTTTPTVHQLRLISAELAGSRYQFTVVAPSSAGTGFVGTCGVTALTLFGAQLINDAGIGFYVDGGCTVRFTAAAPAVDEDYQGTFEGTAQLDPRSVYDGGPQVLTVTNGSFRVKRTF